MRVAAVDCGTNSIRLLVRDGATELHREMRVVRLGQGVDETGELHPDAIERTRLALVDYAAVCDALGVERVRMVATSATRDARNRSAFRDMVLSVLGVEPEVISGAEEAALSFAGAVQGLDDGPYLVMDIGGGSTELAYGSTSPGASYSMDVGCVRLTERHLRDDPPTDEQVAAARADIARGLDAVFSIVPESMAAAATAIGLAGSVTTVAAVALGLSSYQPEAIHHARLSAAQVEEVTERLLAMTRAERAALPVMHPGRVDVIGGGAMVLQSVVRRLGLAEVLVSESDILDGIALSLTKER